jgi:protein TonB
MLTVLAALASAGTVQPMDMPVPAKRARAVTRGELIRSKDYPPESLRNGEHGTVRFQVIVGTNGRIAECRILKSTGFPRLDEATCRAVTARTRFSPARDAAGKRTRDAFTAEMTWALPPG